MRTIACAACGRPFGCGVDAGACWCAQVELDAAARGRLAAAYEDCLCPDCLAREDHGSDRPLPAAADRGRHGGDR